MRFFLLAILIHLSPALATVASSSEKYALLVGVTKYNHDRMNDIKLKFPEADAEAVGEMLKKSGYDVQLLLGNQATKEAIDKALAKAESEGKAGGVVFIGLFGHGVQYNQDAYYGPFDTSVRKVKDSQGQVLRDRDGQLMLEPDPASMISMRSILDTLSICAASNKILIADCCREDPSAARGRAFGSSLRISDLPRGTAALFACSESEQAFESDDWRHGAFTKALLEQCEALSSQGKVRVNSLSGPMYDSVLALVKEKTGGRSKQTVNPLVNGIVDLQLVRSEVPKMITNGIGMKLTLIPAGEFMMGSPVEEEGRYDDEGPQHRVRISKAFYMGTCEVTQSQWEAVMRTKPWMGKAYVQAGFDYAVSYVSWDDAVNFCRKLTEIERKSGRMTTNQRYALPTEAQWEYACRAASTTRFCFGNDEFELKDYGWIAQNTYEIGEEYAHRVGLKHANSFGLHDMHGNVWEWCQDWYNKDYYQYSPGSDPIGPPSGASRVLRGGSWYPSVHVGRSALRGNFSQRVQDNNSGFRVVIE